MNDEMKIEPGEDVAAACAHALLCACAQMIILDRLVHPENIPPYAPGVSLEKARKLAVQMLDREVANYLRS